MLIITPAQERNRDMFSIFFNMKVCCVFSLESPYHLSFYALVTIVRENYVLPLSVRRSVRLSIRRAFKNCKIGSSVSFRALHRYYKYIEDMHVTFCRRKKYFCQKYGIFNLDNFEVRLQLVCVINSSLNFQAINLKLCTNCTTILKNY